MKRIGVIGIVIKNPHDVSLQIQNILSDFSDIIIGRMGVPVKENDISTISIIVKGTNERISALSGNLGRLDNINMKTALTSVEVEN